MTYVQIHLVDQEDPLPDSTLDWWDTESFDEPVSTPDTLFNKEDRSATPIVQALYEVREQITQARRGHFLDNIDNHYSQAIQRVEDAILRVLAAEAGMTSPALDSTD